ncbi:hypothetical protein F8388_023291 [Cannabis sativa]|uniref:Uncharacterized protein n=1 Tax=Cannabis sativa TaxID=3483 RepID=A0A7J6HMN6_CANSA|nr:hypothetical protein F8388_023291 [Cannabis sativa]KAF4396546.1 hypothetical protein G4B88_028860 [Cannabis sativa]
MARGSSSSSGNKGCEPRGHRQLQGRQHCHPGQDPGHRWIRRRSGGIPPCEGPETDQAGDGSSREGRSYPYAPSLGVSAAIGGGVRGEPKAGVGGAFQGRGFGRCFGDDD